MKVNMAPAVALAVILAASPVAQTKNLYGRVELSVGIEEVALTMQEARLDRFKGRLFGLLAHKKCDPEIEAMRLASIWNDRLRHAVWQHVKVQVIPFTGEGDALIRQIEMIARQEDVKL